MPYPQHFSALLLAFTTLIPVFATEAVPASTDYAHLASSTQDHSGGEPPPNPDVPIRIVSTTEAPAGSLHVIALERLAQSLNARSDGRLLLEVHYLDHPDHPAIRGEEENVNMVMSGLRPAEDPQRVDLTIVATGNLSRVANFLDFLMLPYLFENLEAAHRLFGHPFLHTELNDRLAEQFNVRVLGWLVGGFRHLSNAQRQVSRIEHLQGLRIRVPQNRIMQATYLALGAEVVPLPWGDTYAALARGDINGQENPLNVMVEARFWEVGQRHVTLNGAFLYTAPILINETFYRQLSEADRRLLLAAAKDAVEHGNSWSAGELKRFRGMLEDEGVVFTDLEDREKWVARSRGVWDSPYMTSEERRAILRMVQDILQ